MIDKLNTTNYILLRVVILIAAFILLAYIAYTISIQSTSENLPIYNMKELAFTTPEAIYQEYPFIVWPNNFIFLIPLLPIVFTILFANKTSIWTALLGSAGIIVLWISFWEIFFRTASVMVLQSGLEGFNTSHSVFFDGITSLMLSPLIVIAGLVCSILLYYLFKSHFRKLVS